MYSNTIEVFLPRTVFFYADYHSLCSFSLEALKIVPIILDVYVVLPCFCLEPRLLIMYFTINYRKVRSVLFISHRLEQ